MIIVNFKNYKTGARALALTKDIQKHLKRAIVCVPTADIYRISKNTSLKVYAQHVDAAEPGRGTGFVTAESVASDGAVGTLLNHSEHRLPFDILKKTLVRCTKNNLKCIVCAGSLQEVKKIIPLKPYAIAFEDPTLIASGKSITSVAPKKVLEFCSMLKGKKILPICGAGISTSEDVKSAVRLGCKGVLIASALAQSSRHAYLLKQLSIVESGV